MTFEHNWLINFCEIDIRHYDKNRILIADFRDKFYHGGGK